MQEAPVIPNQRLKYEREKQGWSQKDLADRLSITSDTVSRWERGVNFPHAYFRNKLCAIFNQCLQELGLAKENEYSIYVPSPSSPPEKHSSPASSWLFDPVIPPSLTPNKGLVGRDELLYKLKQKLCNGKNAALAALNGLPGVGKTALAVALAHDDEILSYFHDGVLWAGLGPRPNILALLSRWGGLLEVAQHQMARLTTIEAWASAIRAVIGMRRMLLVIDDAWEIDAAIAFQVGGPHCAYLLTSRFPKIARQFAHDGAAVVHELNEVDSLLLLSQLAPDAMIKEADKVRPVVQLVGGLPLALTLIGEYLWTQFYKDYPERLLTAVNRLQCVEERIHLSSTAAFAESCLDLATATPRSLQTVIDISGQHLDEQAQYALSALAVFPAKPHSFSEEAALAVCNLPVEVLDTLTDAGLLEGSAPGRYTLHQTIADYARLHLTAIPR